MESTSTSGSRLATAGHVCQRDEWGAHMVDGIIDLLSSTSSPATNGAVYTAGPLPPPTPPLLLLQQGAAHHVQRTLASMVREGGQSKFCKPKKFEKYFGNTGQAITPSSTPSA